MCFLSFLETWVFKEKLLGAAFEDFPGMHCHQPMPSITVNPWHKFTVTCLLIVSLPTMHRAMTDVVSVPCCWASYVEQMTCWKQYKYSMPLQHLFCPYTVELMGQFGYNSCSLAPCWPYSSYTEEGMEGMEGRVKRPRTPPVLRLSHQYMAEKLAKGSQGILRGEVKAAVIYQQQWVGQPCINNLQAHTHQNPHA